MTKVPSNTYLDLGQKPLVTYLWLTTTQIARYAEKVPLAKMFVRA